VCLTTSDLLPAELAVVHETHITLAPLAHLLRAPLPFAPELRRLVPVERAVQVDLDGVVLACVRGGRDVGMRRGTQARRLLRA